MHEQLVTDISVIGSGVTGLLVARGAARLGLSVVLVERQPKIGSGATTRNEGWLHHGTYHATSIVDKAIARFVAMRCIYGAHAFKSMTPEAIEEPLNRSIAFSSRGDKISEIEDRWSSAGVVHNRIALSELRSNFPNLHVGDIVRAYEVADTAINTRVACAILLQQCKSLGVRFIPEFSLEALDDHGLFGKTRTEAVRIRHSLGVATVGYGLAQLCQIAGFHVPSIRYWKSHLLVVPRYSTHRLFSLDPGDVALMHHQDSTIIGQNEDAKRVTAPSTEVDEDSVEGTLRASAARLRVDRALVRAAVACTKIDLAPLDAAARSLSPSVHSLSDRLLAVLPGKMSEAPYVVDRVVAVLSRQLDAGAVASRPCDVLTDMAREWSAPNRHESDIAIA